ncbi:MAG: hypothetical protein R2699_18760 [Acidimicrobiales bacterium]|nr:hypothetical protein [Acidimicrobiales bacterium]MCB1251582.1 hypothetical protein [Acidimicrobiales bacterium]MCB1261641.1 hypothetical protein [Acidimicrobiales bacterium]
MSLLDASSATRSGNVWREDSLAEVSALKDALRVTRSNPWLATDVDDPELETFLDAIVKPAPALAEPTPRERANPWQEFFDAAR